MDIKTDVDLKKLSSFPSITITSPLNYVDLCNNLEHLTKMRIFFVDLLRKIFKHLPIPIFPQ